MAGLPTADRPRDRSALRALRRARHGRVIRSPPRSITDRAEPLSHRWLALVLITRAAATATAVALLAVHRVTDEDGTLTAIVIAYAAMTSLLAARFPRVTLHPAAWMVDIAVPLALIALSGDWRSPFYLLSLTTLAAPAAALGVERGVLVGLAYAAAYAIIAHRIGPDPFLRGSQSTVETLATHLVLPVLGTFGIGYAAETLGRLHEEQRRSQRLAIEAERRRIAWELHDSAKQRIHAAHLVLSAVEYGEDSARSRAVRQAMREISAAAADMDTSLAELQSPLEGRPLDEALRERAAAAAGERRTGAHRRRLDAASRSAARRTRVPHRRGGHDQRRPPRRRVAHRRAPRRRRRRPCDADGRRRRARLARRASGPERPGCWRCATGRAPSAPSW